MAITRAQQVRQMLEDGGMLVQPSMTGKRPGYRGDAAARSTGAEQSGRADPGERGDPGEGANREGDFAPTKDEPAFTSPDRFVNVDEKTIKKEKEKYNRQFTSKGLVPPGPNRKKRQAAFNYVNRNMSRYLDRFGSFYDPTKFGVTKTGYPGFGIPNIYDLIDEELDARKDIRDILKTGNMKPIGTSGTSFEMSAVPDLDVDSIRELASTQTTMQGAPITGYQADALEDLRESISKRDNLIETGDTSGIYPDPPEPAPDRDSNPCLGPNPPAYCFIGTNAPAKEDEEEEFDFARLLAGGGMPMDAPYVGGGIMDAGGRQQYFLGKLVKSAKKAVRGVTRSLKKITKSPIGKAALLAAAGGYGFGLGPFKGMTGSGFLSSTFGTGGGLESIGNLFRVGGKPGGDLSMLRLLGGGALALSPFLMKPEDEDEDIYRGPDIDFQKIINDPYAYTLPRQYAEGGDVEPVAKKTMPLLDMDGKEMDLRAEGGFVPIGRMEKADDVPARLSKNEFVFTADAVRNAGEGDVDKGAEVMYNMMKNLESGGEVSEESQGLSGAREMFQTSKRLEEVL